MKIKYLLLGIIIISSVVIASCSKDDPDPTPNTNELNFTALTATDTVIEVNGVTTITANAAGEGLSYTWTAEYGTFMGSGNTVQWTVCHVDKFKISCEVKDQQNNSVKKDIYVRTYEPTR